MAIHQSKAQKETVERVMHEFKHGELKTSRGKKVKNPKQAIAIGLHEAGASKYESKEQNRQNLKRTKARERRGATEKDRSEDGSSPCPLLYSATMSCALEERMDEQRIQDRVSEPTQK